MALLYSLKAFWILLAALLMPVLLLFVTMFLMLLHIQSQVLWHLGQAPVAGSVAQISLQICVTSESREVHHGGVGQVQDHQLLVKLSPVEERCVVERSVAMAWPYSVMSRIIQTIRLSYQYYLYLVIFQEPNIFGIQNSCIQYRQLQFGFWQNDPIYLSLGGLVIYLANGETLSELELWVLYLISE